MPTLSSHSHSFTYPSNLFHTHSQKPQQVLLNPSKEYNPQESATWLALQESSASEIDFEKAAKYTSLKEHDPVYSEVYQAPKNPHYSPPKNAVTCDSHDELDENSLPQTAQPPTLQPPSKARRAAARSPVADFLPQSMMRENGPQETEGSLQQANSQAQPSHVMTTFMADSSGSMDAANVLRDMPMYETNAIGGRKKITQSASFNKVMMDVLGE